MMDFEVKRCTRRCAASDRELAPGEPFYSVLVPQGAEVVRQDFSEEAWHGPPAGAVGWWRSRMPEPQARRFRLAPNEVMRNLFLELEDQPEKQDLRYVLALLLVRRRVLQLTASEPDEQGVEHLLLSGLKDETEYRVPVKTPDEQRAAEIQDQLAQLLYADAG